MIGSRACQYLQFLCQTSTIFEAIHLNSYGKPNPRLNPFRSNMHEKPPPSLATKSRLIQIYVDFPTS